MLSSYDYWDYIRIPHCDECAKEFVKLCVKMCIVKTRIFKAFSKMLTLCTEVQPNLPENTEFGHKCDSHLHIAH